MNPEVVVIYSFPILFQDRGQSQNSEGDATKHERFIFLGWFARYAKMLCFVACVLWHILDLYFVVACCGYVETTRDELLQLPALSSIAGTI